MRRSDEISAVIEATFPSEMATYVANKRRGGDNGAKGVRYEDLFFVTKIVQAAIDVLDGSNAETTHLTAQCYGFVDDARVSTAEATVYHQLKNAASVSWASGDHPIAKDFESQMVLSKQLAEPAPSTRLVVPTSEQKEKLDADMPDEIRKHSAVEFFAAWKSPGRLVAEDEHIRVQLARLTRMPDPPLDEMAGLFGALLIASLEFEEGASVLEILDVARTMYPAQIRVLPPIEDGEKWLTSDFKEVMGSINGLSYASDRGHFRWSAFGVSGILPWAMSTKEFSEFQQRVVESKPMSVDEFERFYP